MSFPDLSHLEWDLALPYLSVLVAAVAAIGAIASAIISRKVYVSQTCPVIIVYIDYDRAKRTIVLWIKNIGGGVAYDVAFHIGELPGLDEFDKGFVDRLNDKGIRMLAPGASVNSIVGAASSSVFGECDFAVTVSASYYGRKGMKGTKYEGEFVLDYGAFLESTYTDSEEHQTRKAVEAIRKEIEKSTSVIKSSIASLKR